MSETKRLIIGISGASGIIYGVRLLEILKAMENIETHLVITKAAERTRDYETSFTSKDIKDLADIVHPVNDIGATIASGSFKTEGMIIAPCSVKTLAEIATGVTTSLISRAAEVCLKERRKLILAVRETPLTLTHINNMKTVTENGGIITPPVPAFYHQPKTINDIVDHTIGRWLDLLNIESDLVKRWEG